MRLKTAVEYLKKQCAPMDSSDDGLKRWHSYEDAIAFLMNTTGDDVPVYIGGTDFYLYSLIVPLERLEGDYVADLCKWNFSVSSGFGHGYSVANGEPVPFFCEPVEHTGSRILDGATALFFLRSFPWGDTTYIEINQKVSHVLGIHWVEDKRAWCNLNDLGEIVPVARWESVGDMNYCTVRKQELDYYLFLANACLIRVFDVTRSTDWSVALAMELCEALYEDNKNEIYAMRGTRGDPSKPMASWLRGFQIIRCGISREEMIRKLEGKEARQYASFIIWDWKNHQVREWTSDPSELANYFVKSDLPFETSPAFFKPEVLLQYRQDPTRYTIKERHIECRGAWSLRYDINEEGQVHVYIYDLSRLPYEEQLRWKAFNEPPKAGISARALKTDFMAQWDLDYDPLRSLKTALEKFPQQDKAGRPSPIWQMPKLPDTRNLDFLGYVVTESRKEWEDQVMTLAQILVEGLNASYIYRLAEARSCRDLDLKAGKQLAKIMEQSGMSPEDVKAITAPLAELWDLRSSLIAHPGCKLPASDLRKHFRGLVERCDSTVRRLAQLVEEGFFVLPS